MGISKEAAVRIAFIVIILSIVIYQNFFPENETEAILTGEDVSGSFDILIRVRDTENNLRIFEPGAPVNVSREVRFRPETVSTGSFYLPKPKLETFRSGDQFIGDVDKGGSCNVDIITYVPHNVTHAETSSHVTRYGENAVTLNKIPAEYLTGIALLIDLSDLPDEPGSLISRQHIESKLEQNNLPITMLAVKTGASGLPADYDFSGKNYMAVTPEAAAAVHDYSPGDSRIDCLLLDLPSIDPEEDEGKLSAHRAIFGLPETGHDMTDAEMRLLVELADFSALEEGYYYVVITLPRFETNAAAAGIVFRTLVEREIQSR